MTEKRGKRVDSWKTANVGIDTDPWLRNYRFSVQAYGTNTDTLDFYMRLFTEAPVAIIVTTPKFMIADANVRAQKLLGLPLKKMRGRPFQTHIAKSDRPIFTEMASKLLGEVSQMSRPLLLRGQDDRGIEVMLNAVTLRSGTDEPEFISLVLLERGENVSSDLV